MTIIPIYAAVLALLFVALSVRVIRQRMRVQAAIGTRGDQALERAVRVHGNFAEYVPFSLLLLLIAELQDTLPILLHVLGLTLVLGRLAHAWGVSQVNESMKFRQVGMTSVFVVIVFAAATVLVNALMG
jgi:uncharacterized membrane protein YecN with MAPEG domain